MLMELKYSKRINRYLLDILKGKRTLTESEEKITDCVYKMIKYEVKRRKNE